LATRVFIKTNIQQQVFWMANMTYEIAAPGVSVGGQPLKRLIDILGAITGLILAAPIFALISLCLIASGDGKVIFRQIRLGKNGKDFVMLKFHTMRAVSDKEFQRFLDLNPIQKFEYEKFQKLADDPRMTNVGQFLRRTSLDELPQLWNVLKGEMSLVGPRPVLPEQAQMYGRTWELYTRARPGITGLWQVSGRNCLSFQERVDCDSFYLTNWSLSMEISILLHTPRAVLLQRGAY
jgi:undecaprenyl-phosphate galactose phosphotransferase